MTSRVNAGRVASLDGLRGVAVLSVLFHHTLQVPTGGYLGVELFFTLSGFLISSLLLDEIDARGRPQFGRFYRRRALRLVPAFLCAVALYLGIRFCFAPSEPSVGPLRLLEVLFLSNVYVSIPYLSHAWSLSVEWQFYFAWPFVLTVLVWSGLSKKKIAMLMLVAVAAIWILRFYSKINLRVDGLLLGASLAIVLSDPKSPRLTLNPIIEQIVLGLALCAAIALMFASDYQGILIPYRTGLILAPVLCVVMLYIAMQSHGFFSRVFLSNSILVFFGRISYGLYLYHFPVAAAMYVRAYSPLAAMLVVFVVCIPLSDFSWRYLESPLLRLGRSTSKMPRLSAAAPVRPHPASL